MTSSNAELDVLRNPDTDAGYSFLGWPILIEIAAENDADNESIVGTTSSILKTMWDAGIPTVAACDYEDELPWRGGIGRIEDNDLR
ncbi:hypothetical protein [Microlunatus parietis]|uniref:Uncharacterized protein n=1 Tax=Microlunatus parietis TaxID=682979 RepID=A0A7Y9I6A1_9ACTN|nr:hypothetical protein [Microlunatus parietis]NYE71081.1 hypothetical protein [Microlunatus parietis]